MTFSSLKFFTLFKKTEIMKCHIYHFVFIVSLAHMILHPELFTYKALVSGLEITELILLQVNFNLSLYVLCNCYFNNFFKLLFYMYLETQKKASI